MKSKLSQFDITNNNYRALQGICPLNRFRVCDPEEIPIDIPAGLANKSLKAVVIGSGDMSNAVYMVNYVRIDKKDYAIDHEPLMIAYHSGDSGIDLTAVLVHHGNWKGRSIYPGTGFFAAIEGSEIEQYYPLVGIPIKTSGDIAELDPIPHKETFWNGIKFVKNNGF